MTDNVNDHLVLISGDSGTGKTVSLRNLPDHKRVIYLACEAGKKVPFKNKFQVGVITDPYEVYDYFDHAQNNPDYDVIVIDTLTFLMEMYESIYVLPSTNTQQAWGQYAQYFRELMQDKVAKSDKAIIFLAHNVTEVDEKAMSFKTRVGLKGAIGKGNGVESYFSTVVSTKKITLKDLEPYKSDLLHISEQDEMLGYKHVFQTQLTKETIGERIRAPIDMFTREETFIDNDVNILLNRLREYYGD